MINITSSGHQMSNLRPGDSGFILNNGYTVAGRAGIEISSACPGEYRLIIAEALKRKWIVPVATVYDYELTWEKLNEAS